MEVSRIGTREFSTPTPKYKCQAFYTTDWGPITDDWMYRPKSLPYDSVTMPYQRDRVHIILLP